MKILLVDDDAFLRDMYATKFSELGHVVEVAENSAAALQKLESAQDYDMVLLDMVMPGLSGVELMTTIKEKFTDFKGKCVVLSNQGQQEDIDMATQAGADGYIIKAESIPSDVVKKIEKIASE